MNGIVKKILIAAVILIALIVAGAVAAVALIDVNTYKPKIEAAVLDATGLELKINGKIGISFFPIGVTASDMHISGKDGRIAGLQKLTVGVELLPLLKKEIKVSRCDLEKPVINIVKKASGKFNYEETTKAPVKKQAADKKGRGAAAGAALSVSSLSVSNANVVYVDAKNGDRIELKDMNLSIKNFVTGPPGDDMIKQLSFSGNFDCRQAVQKKITIDNIRASIKAEKGVFEVKPVSMDAFGGKGDGDAKLDISGSAWGIKKDFRLNKFNFEKMTDSFGQKKSIGGEGNVVLAFTARGKEMKQVMASMNGSFSLRGDNLILYTMDLDKKLSSIEGRDKLSLVDLSSVVGLDSLLGSGDAAKKSQGEQGVIKKMVSDWKITNGIAESSDVAIATLKHRVAVKGKLNLVSERYDNLVLAVIDEKGCARFKQTLNGPFSKPKADTKETLKTVVSSLESFGLFGKKKEQQPAPDKDSKCEVFYSGSVPAPALK
jgi:AsmA protein